MSLNLFPVVLSLSVKNPLQIITVGKSPWAYLIGRVGNNRLCHRDTLLKCVLSNFNNTLRNDGGCDAGAAGERAVPNDDICPARFGKRPQGGTAGKSVIPNRLKFNGKVDAFQGRTALKGIAFHFLQLVGKTHVRQVCAVLERPHRNPPLHIPGNEIEVGCLQIEAVGKYIGSQCQGTTRNRGETDRFQAPAAAERAVSDFGNARREQNRPQDRTVLERTGSHSFQGGGERH